MKDLTGTILKGYEIQERIGVGGFGAVYKARQSTVGREVAIKIILPGFANQPDFIRRFETEAQTIARLEHMHVVPLYDFWRDPEGAYIVMRWYRGGSLRDALADNGGYELQAANLLLNQITSGLSVAHRSHVIHRDLKPGNILLDEDSNAYLADFGIAKNIAGNGEITEPDQIIGSPDYLAPEQARSEPVTPQTDIYSLGVVLYEVLTGEHPFPNLTGIERLFKHINEPLPMIENLDPSIQDEVNAVIQKATEKNPAHRYADVLEMAAAFRAAVNQRNDASPSEVVSIITPREQEILQLMIAGMTNREIAERLFIEHSTVKWYIKQIYKKLEVRSRMQAIVRARELNFVVEVPENGHPTVIGDPSTSILAALPTPENPYKGLHAFQTADEKDFFGREKLTQKLIKRMSEKDRYARFLAIVGPSGSGKSSLVKAGLIPALWRGELQGSEKWFIVDMLPGDRPLDKLEVALSRVAADQASNMGEHLRRDENGLLRAADLILPDDGSELVLIIDQFEEVFTLLENEEKRLHFLRLIHAAVTGNRSRVRVVVTLRADFYDRPLMYPEIAELVRDRVETVLPLTAKELESAILNPAKNVGVKFEEGLVATIADEVSYQPGALPLLQYALTELFEQREGRTLTHATYQEIGGTVGALAKRAEEIYQEFTEEAQETARQMFLRLVTLGEGVEDTRRRTPQSELAAITDNEDLLTDIIDVFAEYRLLSLDNDPATRTPTVEVAHEAILREWERLRNWLNESRNDVRMQRQLAQMAREWRESNQDKSFLLRGARLENFEGWIADTGLAVTAQERDFLIASTTEHQREKAEAKAQAEREATLEKRAWQVLQGLVGVFLIAAIIGGALAFLANQQRIEAGEQRDTAQQERDRAEAAEQEALRQASIGIAAQAVAELDGNFPERSTLLALEALEHYPFTQQAKAALIQAIDQYRAVRVLHTFNRIGVNIETVEWSPDGTQIAIGSFDPGENMMVILDANSGEEMLVLGKYQEDCEGITSSNWAPSGDYIVGASSTAGCPALIWDTTNAEIQQVLPEQGSTIVEVVWSPDGAWIATGQEDGSIILWDVSTGESSHTLTGHSARITDLRWSPDGALIASASADSTIRIWRSDGLTQSTILEGHIGTVNAVAWAPDGTRILSGSDDGQVRIWNVETGEALLALHGYHLRVLDVDWSHDGKRIASTSVTTNIWDASSGAPLFEVPYGGFGYFSPDDTQLLTGGGPYAYQRIAVWDVAPSTDRLVGHLDGAVDVDWSPDGSRIASLGARGSAWIWDVASGQVIASFDYSESMNEFGDWSPDGTYLVIPNTKTLSDELPATYPSEVMLWNIANDEVIHIPVPEHLWPITTDWSPDGAYFLSSLFNPTGLKPIYVWDAKTHELLHTLEPDDDCMQAFAEFSPDSSKIVAACFYLDDREDNTSARIWDVATGELIIKIKGEHGSIYHATWSHDGKRILATFKGIAQIWDAESGEVLTTFAGHPDVQINGADWSPNGDYVVTGDGEGNVKVWYSDTAEELVSYTADHLVVTTNWSPDGQYVVFNAAASDPVIKRVWTSTEELIAHAYECCVTRELTPEERAQFGLPPRGD